MLRKNVKSLLEQLQVCIFAEIVFGVRCTLKYPYKFSNGGSFSHPSNLYVYVSRVTDN